VRIELPSGTVTFLFTDVEGSTRLLHELGEAGYAEALAEHRRVLREAFAAYDGVEVDTQGDAFFVAFPTSPGALGAAAAFTEALGSGPIRVRVGVHTGTPLLTDEGYVGADVHRAARIAACGHGGQVLVSASTAALLDASNSLLQGMGLRDLGEHRLKDLSAAERIFQLGDGEFPALKSLYRTNLPVPATPFVGREIELEELRSLLERARLLTLTGPGGTGKTRLALQAAAAAADNYPDGVYWIPLAPLRDPELVLAEAAAVLGAQGALADHIADKHLLLLLDNFEHVVEAALGLSELLATCPNLRLLVTSRELLRLPGEQAYPVLPLAPEDGTALFLARARTVEPSFVADDAVPELCARLEQIPLALELAAARVPVLPPRQLLGRLSQRLDLLRAGRGIDQRQQTLRATIEWSYELLTESERGLFAQLAVFHGGCTLADAEEICSANLDTLHSLVEKSLVRRTDERFWMLETIREYAAERLEESEDVDELRGRHAEHYLALAEDAAPSLRELWHRGPTPASSARLDQIEREHDNLRAALDVLHATGESQRELRLAGALWNFWIERGFFDEGHRRLESALTRDLTPTAARALALLAATDLGSVRPAAQPLPESRREIDEALAIYRGLDDRGGIARALWALADWSIEKGDPNDAVRWMEQAVELLGSLDDPYETLEATRYLAYVLWATGGDLGRRVALLEEVVESARRLGAPRPLAIAQGALALGAAQQGRIADALALVHEFLKGRADIDPLRLTAGLFRAGYILARAGRPEAAVRLLAAEVARSEEIGARQPWLVPDSEATLALLRVELGDDAFRAAWDAGISLSLDEAVELALRETATDA
jgi:predicted ATPase/class 3 adenylate cyclase